MQKRDNRKNRTGADTVNWQNRFQTLAEQAHDERLKRFYQAGSVSPDTPIRDVPLVSLDFETTGLDSTTHSIVSIGLVLCDAERVYCRDSRHWVVRPLLPQHRESVTFHGITHASIRKAPDLREILGDLLEALAGRVVLVHHRAIERQFLEVALLWRIQ
jgi:DNA polymerase-3 subunit epsilon